MGSSRTSGSPPRRPCARTPSEARTRPSRRISKGPSRPASSRISSSSTGIPSGSQGGSNGSGCGRRGSAARGSTPSAGTRDPGGRPQMRPGAPAKTRAVNRSIRVARDLVPEDPVHAPPDPPVLPELRLEVVHPGPVLEGPLRLRVRAAVGGPLVEAGGGEAGLELLHDLWAHPDDVRRVLAVQEGRVVDVEHAHELLDGGRA